MLLTTKSHQKSYSHTILLKISIAFLGLALAAAQALANSDWLDQLEPLDSPQMIRTPDDGDQPLIDSMSKAQHSIKIVIFHISNPNVVDTLVKASNRGVKVTIIADDVQFRNTNNLRVVTQLKAAGVDIIHASKAFNITHEKTFLVDDELLFISTMNFVTTFASTRDYGIFMKNKSFIKEWLNVFNTDLDNAKNNTNKTPDLTVNNLVWSPVSSHTKLTELIDSAQKSIELTVENMGEDGIQLSLSNALKRGVSVKMITPECVMGVNAVRNEKFLKSLEALGGQSHLMTASRSANKPYMHAKTINVDGEKAYLGSENFSNNSLNYSRELGMIFEEAELIGSLHDSFSQDWKISTPLDVFKEGHCSSSSDVTP